ncbi:DoxX family protein [Alkalilimnicola sp. S0819]|uniref:DoxX family protein n=1 Tax=Alkalilimnicola sp. S0819 TaxID=2613922 RepID=UPI0012613DC0|nr:DoxX family protein [Alkalilimnicola sp. S0819]KAB7624203.1 DoxX family protein [Alkalilimnicola sp. S0819]MPQ16458.1 DoxX family membrane protein [Alkalilimnicola sp. S0819]
MRPVERVQRLVGWAAAIPMSLPQLLLRVTVAIPFWKSSLTKFDGFLELSPGAVYLFANEFKLHLFGATYPYPFPGVMAFVSGLAEFGLSLLLVLGLGTRFAAFGLLIMTGVIQLTVPGGWQTFHLPWAAMLLAVLAYGPGRVSVDYWIARHFR